MRGEPGEGWPMNTEHDEDVSALRGVVGPVLRVGGQPTRGAEGACDR